MAQSISVRNKRQEYISKTIYLNLKKKFISICKTRSILDTQEVVSILLRFVPFKPSFVETDSTGLVLGIPQEKPRKPTSYICFTHSHVLSTGYGADSLRLPDPHAQHRPKINLSILTK